MIADGFLLHPLGVCSGTAHQVMLCRGYAFWSGIGSDFGEITLFGIAVGAALTAWKFWHRWKQLHECHLDDCTRIAWHPHPVHGHPVCKTHWHELGDDHALTHPTALASTGGDTT